MSERASILKEYAEYIYGTIDKTVEGLRVRGLAQVSIHVSLSLISMLAVALSAVRQGTPGLVRCIKRFVE